MMFIPSSYPPAAYDPIERERIESGRPATHLEVLQRNRRVDRLHLLASNEREEDVRSRDDRNPGLFDGIRRTISRALIQTGERIDPQAA